MVLVPSFSKLLSFFLPLAFGAELFVGFDGLSAGVGIVSSAFMCITIFISSISPAVAWRRAPGYDQIFAITNPGISTDMSLPVSLL